MGASQGERARARVCWHVDAQGLSVVWVGGRVGRCVENGGEVGATIAWQLEKESSWVRAGS